MKKVTKKIKELGEDWEYERGGEQTEYSDIKVKPKVTKYDAQFMEVADLPPFAEFISRVTEMYAHNIVHYPEENPTLDGAFREVLVDMIDQVILTEQREAENGKS